MKKNDLIFHQMFESETSTYTYLLADAVTKEAILIDPVMETVDRDLKLIQELGLKLVYVLDTHIHADHVTGAGLIREKTGAKTAVSEGAKVSCVDISLRDGQELQFGSHTIKVIATPGHTDSCMSFYTDGKVFTGDALLIRGNGRTDFQQGSAEKLYDSITNRLFTLPPETEVYPAHDYRGHEKSTIEQEMKYNTRIGGGRTKEEFVKIMSELKLANPKKIQIAVPANLACGKRLEERLFKPKIVNDAPEIQSEDLKPQLGKAKVVDIRTAEEVAGELGYISGAINIPLDDLPGYLAKLDRSEELIFVCRSGNRSYKAVRLAQDMGFQRAVHMAGGMLKWNELKYPVESGGKIASDTKSAVKAECGI